MGNQPRFKLQGKNRKTIRLTVWDNEHGCSFTLSKSTMVKGELDEYGKQLWKETRLGLYHEEADEMCLLLSEALDTLRKDGVEIPKRPPTAKVEGNQQSSMPAMDSAQSILTAKTSFHDDKLDF